MTTLSAKQVLNLRSGQTVYYVWGNTVTDLYVVTAHLIGKRSNIKEPHYWGTGYRGYIWKREQAYNDAAWKIGLGFQGYYATSLGGALGDHFFTKKHQAEKYMQECLEGLHPRAMMDLAEHHYNCDLLDEAMGIDRGLGTYVEPDYDDFDDTVDPGVLIGDRFEDQAIEDGSCEINIDSSDHDLPEDLTYMTRNLDSAR